MEEMCLLKIILERGEQLKYTKDMKELLIEQATCVVLSMRS
jgi:hypothetical protein